MSKRWIIAASVLAVAGMSGMASADISLQSNNATLSPAAVYQPGGTGIGTFSWFTSTNLSNATIPYSNNIGTSSIANGNILTDGQFSSGSSGYNVGNSSPLRTFLWGFRPLNGSTVGSSLGGSPGGVSSMTISPTTIAQGTSAATINFSNVQLGSAGFETYKFSVVNDVSVSKPGTGQALVTNKITVQNTAATVTQNLQFFLMVDSQIFGAFNGGNDTFGAVTGTVDALGRRLIQFQDTAVVNPATGSAPYTVTFGALNAGAWEAGTETTAGAAIRTKLATSSNGTTNQLSNSTSFVSGDPFGGYTWNVTLAPGQSASFSGFIAVNTTIPIPEPTSLAVLGATGLLALRRRGR